LAGVASDELRRALRDGDSELNLRPLPAMAEELLFELDAPPRLAAHLRAVHDVAVQLVDWFEKAGVAVDRATAELQIVVERVAAATGRPRWEVFAEVDDHLTAIGRHAVQRIAFQNSY
jgi:hypothetical protein